MSFLFQHPFIQPVLDIDFRMVKDQMYVMLVFPYNKTGSLKDILYSVSVRAKLPIHIYANKTTD